MFTTRAIRQAPQDFEFIDWKQLAHGRHFVFTTETAAWPKAARPDEERINSRLAGRVADMTLGTCAQPDDGAPLFARPRDDRARRAGLSAAAAAPNAFAA